ncbi:MAG: 50S ribosomal protein L33 [Chloroflexi bacterium]|nr:50S ribosomal protein L33 [Chloroflexota bacterium]MQG01803.1 50S ribosomal protein L33 [SAR202 cluster bacterium]
MARRGENRILVTFSCVDCRQRTYNSNKSRRNDPQRLELKKYCPRCRTHTLHREVR